MSRRPRRSLLVLLATMVVVALLTRATFRAAPGSSRQDMLSYALALVLLIGATASGPAPKEGRRRWAGPALVGVLLYLAFVALSWVTSWVGPIENGADEILRHARAGSEVAVLLGAMAAGLAEEVFYRGALFERLRLPVITTTLAHMATTLPAGNVALTLAAGFLGLVLGASRRTSGGWWAPAVTHVVWSLLVVSWLPR